MLDPRIYRTGLVAVALAVIVLAFSLGDQQGPQTTTLAPEAFNAGHAYAAMNRIAKQFPNRRPGSAADAAHREQVLRVLGILLELLAEVSDMDVDRARVAVRGVSPDP